MATNDPHREARQLCAQAGDLRERGRAGEALALYRQALARAPDLFDAGFGLAMTLVELGDRDLAEKVAARLLAGHPDNPGAGWLAGRIAAERGDFPAAIARLQPLLARTDLAPTQRAEALLLLSQAFDGLDRTGEAFAAAAQGKAIQRAAHAERAARREGEVDKLNRLAAWFASAGAADWTPAPDLAPIPDAAATHIFLVGFPRSGTTLLEQVLAGHPDVSALEEAPTLAEPYAEFMASGAGLERLSRLSPDEAQVWRARYWAQVNGFGVNAAGRVFLDKAPAGTLYLPLIAKLFPEAKLLFAVRDPRDVVLSCFRNDFQLNAMTYAFTDLAETARCYAACMEMAQAYRRVLPLDLMEVRHEALVEDFDAQLAAIAGFLGVEVSPAMADVAATASRRVVRTPSAVQVRAGLNTRGLARWRAYADHLAPVLPMLAPWVERWGYPAD